MKKWTPQQRVTGEQASPAFMEYLASLERELGAAQGEIATLQSDLAALTGRLDAIAAVTAPAGGATIDAEARTAISDIIAGAA